MTEIWTREVARLRGFDIEDNEHGGLGMGGAFEYEGAGQSLGYGIDMKFVQKLMAVFGVKRLQEINGRHAWVTHSYSDIRLIEPLLKGEGEPFDVHQWAKNPRKKEEQK